MSAIIFVGPTMPQEEIANHIDGQCWPPAAQGDIYRAALQRPNMIGIIDGYFSGAPSVWHKEILWAMAEGIPVYGSASMGALRAAELHAFGMVGIGAIFEDYRDGILEDDDEVAVLHGPAELDFMPLSEPMVSIRSTLKAATGQNILSEDASDQVLGIAKDLNYPDRIWSSILNRARESMGPDPAIAALELWLLENKVDAKRIDATAMLDAMARHKEEPKRDNPAPYTFEWTNVWNGLVDRIDAEEPDALDQMVIDELRLDEARFDAARSLASHHRLALQEAKRLALEADRSALMEDMSAHRSTHRLSRRAQLDQWLDQNRLAANDYERLITEKNLVNRVDRQASEPAFTGILNALKLSGEYSALAARAKAKEERLSRSNANGQAAANSPSELNLLRWYFEELNGQDMPDSPEAYAKNLGFSSRKEFCRVLAREYLYSTLEDDA